MCAHLAGKVSHGITVIPSAAESQAPPAPARREADGDWEDDYVLEQQQYRRSAPHQVSLLHQPLACVALLPPSSLLFAACALPL